MTKVKTGGLLAAAFLIVMTITTIVHAQGVSRLVTQVGPPTTVVPGTVAPPAPTAPTQVAVPVTTVPSPASPQNPSDQAMWALAMSYLLRYVTKKRLLAFLTPEASSQIKAFAGFITATVTAAGIHFAVNGSPLDGHGATITITGLSFDVFKDVGAQWVFQQGWYDFVVKQAKAALLQDPPMDDNPVQPAQPQPTRTRGIQPLFNS